MGPRTLGLLVMSSALNATLCFFVLVFAQFATSPAMDNVTMRIGFYVLNGVAVAAVIAVFAPWFFARKQHTRSAIFFAALPVALLCLTGLAFLLLDSWLSRTFSG